MIDVVLSLTSASVVVITGLLIWKCCIAKLPTLREGAAKAKQKLQEKRAAAQANKAAAATAKAGKKYAPGRHTISPLDSQGIELSSQGARETKQGIDTAPVQIVVENPMVAKQGGNSKGKPKANAITPTDSIWDEAPASRLASSK